MDTVIFVDPFELRLPPERLQGADPAKLARQISRFGRSATGMPPVLVTLGMNGIMQLNDGVTRASRIAKLSPGMRIPAVVIQDAPKYDFSRILRIGDRLP